MAVRPHLSRRLPAGRLLPLLLVLLPVQGTAGADPPGAAELIPLVPGLTCTYRLLGTAVTGDGTVYGLRGEAVTTCGLPDSVGGEETFPVVTVTSLAWQGIAISGADTLTRWMRLTEEGMLLYEGEDDTLPALALPPVPAPGLTWLRVRDRTTDTLAAVSTGRTVSVPAGRFRDCVGILVLRGTGDLSSRTVEYLAPGVGRVFMVEEVGASGGWRVQVLHVLEAVSFR